MLRKAPKKIFKGAFYFYTLKKETIARNAENEVVKKASTLTANGDPCSTGRSLFRGLAFLSTVPIEGHIKPSRLLVKKTLGVYFVRINNANSEEVKKVVVE